VPIAVALALDQTAYMLVRKCDFLLTLRRFNLLMARAFSPAMNTETRNVDYSFKHTNALLC
jgi:hypothetical protein